MFTSDSLGPRYVCYNALIYKESDNESSSSCPRRGSRHSTTLRLTPEDIKGSHLLSPGGFQEAKDI